MCNAWWHLAVSKSDVEGAGLVFFYCVMEIAEPVRSCMVDLAEHEPLNFIKQDEHTLKARAVCPLKKTYLLGVKTYTANVAMLFLDGAAIILIFVIQQLSLTYGFHNPKPSRYAKSTHNSLTLKSTTKNWWSRAGFEIGESRWSAYMIVDPLTRLKGKDKKRARNNLHSCKILCHAYLYHKISNLQVQFNSRNNLTNV